MAAVAGQLSGIAGIIAILAAILAILRRGAVASRMSALPDIGHSQTTLSLHIGRLRVGIVSSDVTRMSIHPLCSNQIT
jgi:hypothetical protein